MEILIAIAAKIAEYTVKPVGQWLCYPFYYSSNIGSMKNQLEELRLARDRVQHSIDAAIRNGEEIEGDVNNWLKEVGKITELARKVLEGEEEARRKGSNGACLNLKLRHKLSRKAKKIGKDIGEVLKKGNFDRVSYHPARQGEVTTSCTDYVDFESRKSTIKRLMEALRDDNIHVIGVWGMPGVGKSTLVGEVANQAKEEKLFDEVALANVTQIPDLRHIQGEIVDTLGLKFDEETVLGRARRLQEWLTKTKDKKKILVILDDIWEYLDLKKIGIPSDHEGCKVLLTSRNQDVLVSGMDTQKDFGLEVLSEKEAWSLFEKMAGNCVKDPNFGSTATNVANACAGLPLALVTVSKALKNKSLKEWKNALRKLKRPSPGHLIKVQSTIFNSIELSYNHLESEEAKVVFLLCSQDYYISEMDLLKYCYGLGLFHSMNTMEEVRESLYANVRILKDCCLLLNSPYSSKIVRMHDVVRDAATIIASRDYNMFVVRVEGGLKEWPNSDALKRCETFSVLDGDICELPKEIECPELKFLYVYGGDRPLQFSDTFFERMGKLKVLDLTKMQLSSLPSSLEHLTNLQTLCLDQCMLGDIAVIGELKNLAILSLHNSNISQLPKEIGLLTRLRLLDLSNCSKLEVIPPNVLSSLIALEELYMKKSFVQWEAKERNNASLTELKHLSHLITLEIHIQDASNLPKDLSFEQFERYAILVGDVWDWLDMGGERTLKLKLNTSFQLEVGIKMLLKRTENLYLDKLKGVKSVLNELDREGFQQLKHLHIQNNTEIKCLINSRTLDTAFPALETILLKNMINLEEICHGQLPLRSFGNLKVVKMEHCNKLKFVFSSSIARGLSQLEELEIRKCSIMGAIVMKEEGEIEDEHTVLLPQLRHLELEHLPKLMSFLSTENSLVTNAGEIMSEGKLDFHMPILHEQVVFPNLLRLKLSSIGLEDIHRATWSSCRLDMQSTSRFQNLLKLEVKGCGNIKYLLSFSTAKFMVHLKYLGIGKCKAMEEILLTEDLGVVEEIIPKVLFPRLKCLLLIELPILERFCQGSNIKFPSLTDLVIDCPKLKTFISKMNTEESPHTAVQPLFNEEVALPSLERLEIYHVDDLKTIWRNQFAVDSFYKLQGLNVLFCKNLVNVFQSNMLARFQSLEELLVRDCGSLEEVFELEGLNVTEAHAVTAIQLKKLYLYRLPKMKHVWNKDPQEIFSFQNLQVVRVLECWSLKSLFPASVARCLTQLEELGTINCGVLEEIVAGEEGAEAITRFVFPHVSKLRLDRLPRLKCFYPGRHVSEWPMLKDMYVGGCHEVDIFASRLLSETVEESQLEFSVKQPLFLVDEVVFPNLKTLQLSSIGLEGIRHNQHRATWSPCRLDMQSTSRFQNLLKLEVKGSNNIKYLLSFSTARYMVQLKRLHISECKVMEEILVTEDLGVVEEIIPEVLFPQLEILFLKELQILKRFCEGSNIKFPSLKQLVIDNCPKLKTFISKPVSLGMMTSCKELKEMNAEESPHTAMQPLFNEEVVFPNLETLQLSSIGLEDIQHNQHRATTSSCRLENMQSTSRFQHLLKLNVKGCGQIKYLLTFSTAKFMVHLKYLSIVECKAMEEILLTEDLGVVEEISFPRLEILILEELPILERFCQGSNIKFPSLKDLALDHCPKLKTFISKPVSLGMTTSCKELKEMNTDESPHTAVQPLFNEEVAFPSLERLLIDHVDDLKIIWRNQFAVDSFYKLQGLKVGFCKNLVNVFQSDMLARFQSLEELFVVDCGSLEEVFELEELNVTETPAITTKDPKPIVSFQNLQRVNVVGCGSLKSIFPAYVATCLTQLKQLVVVGCKILEEIVVGEEAEQPIARFVFPQVTVLHLVDLPRLEWFYRGVHTSEWPMLKDMLVADCDKVEIFASKLSSFQDILLRESKLEITIKQPLFLVDEVPFPCLEKLRISCMLDLKIIWHNQFTADSFCKPQIMKVEFCRNLPVQEISVVTATQLKELHLEHLPKLKHIWNNDPQEIFSLQNPLESMESPFPGVEEDFPEIKIIKFDNDGRVKEIVLRNQNSSVSP